MTIESGSQAIPRKARERGRARNRPRTRRAGEDVQRAGEDVELEVETLRQRLQREQQARLKAESLAADVAQKHRATVADLRRALVVSHQSQQELRALTEGSPLGIFRTTAEGRIDFANARWSEISGCDYRDWQRAQEAVHPDDRDDLATQWQVALSTGSELKAEFRYVHAGGEVHHCLARARPLRNPVGQITGFVGTLEDLTDRKRAEDRFRSLLQAAPDAIVLVDAKGRISLANQQAQAIFGYAPEELIGLGIESLIPSKFRGRHVAHRATYDRNPTARPMGQGLELLGLKRDGTEFPVEISLSPLETDEGTLTMAAVRDITKRKKAEESTARLAAVVNSSVDAIITKTLDGIITSWNDACEKILGYTSAEALGQSIKMLYPEGSAEVEQAILDQVRRGEPVARREMQCVRKDGSLIWVSLTAAPIRDAIGTIVGAASIRRDITERRAIEARVHASLHEKEVLLQEIHHRVKNNLQVVASLMNLQGQYAGEARTRQLFQDSRNRIRSIALVHEKLYRSKDLSRLDFRDYLEDLVKELRRFYPQTPGVAIALQAQSMEIGVDAAINCGLIVSELVSNALKHAFPSGRLGKIQIQIREGSKPGRIEVTVADDGVGMKGPFKPDEASTLGMQLVATLVQQLDGTIERMPGPGTTLRLDLRVESREEK